MVQCEMCGRNSVLVDAIVEGIMLSVCTFCSKHGSVIPVRKPIVDRRPSRKLSISKTIPFDNEVETLVHDYSLRIRKARERKSLKQEQLAQAIAEKESVVQKIESGHLDPPFLVVKKLEQFLGISLIVKTKEIYEKQEINMDDSAMTIGDLMKFKLK